MQHMNTCVELLRAANAYICGTAGHNFGHIFSNVSKNVNTYTKFSLYNIFGFYYDFINYCEKIKYLIFVLGGMPIYLKNEAPMRSHRL